jgi:hypothetical protein
VTVIKDCAKCYFLSFVVEIEPIQSNAENQSIGLVCARWREFRVLCEAKSEKLNRDLRVISTWEPASQTCCCCGYRWGKIDLYRSFSVLFKLRY